jgi:heat shock protein HslJ
MLTLLVVGVVVSLIRAAAPLEESSWLLATLDGKPCLEGARIVLLFDGERNLHSFSGCDHLEAVYTRSGTTFGIQADSVYTYTLEEHCERNAVRTLGIGFRRALFASRSYRVTDGTILTFFDQEGRQLMTFTARRPPSLDPALAQGGWDLLTLYGKPLVPGTHLSLRFEQTSDDGYVSGYAGCNWFSGKFDVAYRGALAINGIPLQPPPTCTSTDASEQERAYLQALDAATNYMLDDNLLTLTDESGAPLLHLGRQESFDSRPADLIGSTWRLVYRNDTPVSALTTLTFINANAAILSVEDILHHLIVYDTRQDDLRPTQMVPVGDIDQPTYDRLRPALVWSYSPWTRYRLTRRALTLFTGYGDVLIFRPLPTRLSPPVETTLWQLIAFVDAGLVGEDESPDLHTARVPDDPRFTLELTQGQLHGRAACHRFVGAYRLRSRRNGQRLTVSGLTVDAEDCPAPESARAQAETYIRSLDSARQMVTAGDILWISTDDEHALVFTAED